MSSRRAGGAVVMVAAAMLSCRETEDDGFRAFAAESARLACQRILGCCSPADRAATGLYSYPDETSCRMALEQEVRRLESVIEVATAHPLSHRAGQQP